jgi:hypothetical protein
MDAATIFERWVPAGAAWSDWVKPVPFSHLPDEAGDGEAAPRPPVALASIIPPGSWTRDHPYRAAPCPDVAVVVDLPGAASVGAGLALAALGFQPVPLFGALPGPTEAGPPVRVAVDMWPILQALVAGAAGLAAPPAGAPPAFLLDAARLGSWWHRRRGDFDNRSLSTWTDFPSAERLRSAGVRGVVVWRMGRRAGTCR